MVYCEESTCDECGTCVSVCPENALVLAASLIIDQEKCTSCGNCMDVCPFAALSLIHKEQK